MIRLWRVLLFVIWSALAAPHPKDAKPASSVTVDIRDLFGHRLPEATVAVKRPGFEVEAPSGAVLRLERGKYEVFASVNGFAHYRGTVMIDQARQMLEIGMLLDSRERQCVIQGRAPGSPDGVRLRLQSLFGTEYRDIPATRDGRFRFTDLECGQYLLSAMREQTCVGLALAVASLKGYEVRLCEWTRPDQQKGR